MIASIPAPLTLSGDSPSPSLPQGPLATCSCIGGGGEIPTRRGIDRTATVRDSEQSRAQRRIIHPFVRSSASFRRSGLLGGFSHRGKMSKVSQP